MDKSITNSECHLFVLSWAIYTSSFSAFIPFYMQLLHISPKVTNNKLAQKSKLLFYPCSLVIDICIQECHACGDNITRSCRKKLKPTLTGKTKTFQLNWLTGYYPLILKLRNTIDKCLSLRKAQKKKRKTTRFISLEGKKKRWDDAHIFWKIKNYQSYMNLVL